MKNLQIQLPKVLLAGIISLGSLSTVVAFSNVNQAIADDQRSENSSISQEMSAEENVVGKLSESESFTTLAKAVEAAGLIDTLQSMDGYTVFAPTDQAFAALPAGTLEALLQPENKETLRRILQYHIVSGEATSSEISAGQFETAAGSAVNIDVMDGMVKVGNAQVVEADIQASNGVIHAIDQVMLPPDISAAELKELNAVR